jgi:phosphoglycolate phosphatase
MTVSDTTSPEPGQRIQIHNPAFQRGLGRHALFDFDGTLSLIRAGWHEVMTAQFVGELAKTGSGESDQELGAVCAEFITRLTGKQTIYQMLELVAQIEQRGGSPRLALEYKHEYLELLHRRISHRLDALREGRDPAPRYQVRGSVELLTGLRSRGVKLYLASGTDQPFVVDEVSLLGLADFFEGRVYGARDDYESFSKQMVIEEILRESGLAGPELLVFGDGYVEIENGKQAGGVAVGAATMEDGSDDWDPWKRQRLLEVGADVLVPHWGEADALLRLLFAE